MICTFARSSGLANYKFCEMQYFLTYNLGIQQTTNKKAVIGTCVHKIYEWICLSKLNHNNDMITFFDDSLNEQITIDSKKLYQSYTLEDSIVNQINKTRANKSIYKTECKIPYGTVRVGYEIINDLVIKAFKYYSAKYSHDWTTLDLQTVGNILWMALEYKDGLYDPRNIKIVSSEYSFELPIEADWAKYDYTMGDERITGNFGIKGTIDCLSEHDSDTMEIIDLKTGQRLNWATGEVKDYAALCKDEQLWLYFYAASRLFPQYKNILLTIFFIRDGGAYTVAFEKESIKDVENMLKKHFNDVRNNQLPKMLHPQQKDFRCTKLCSYYKNDWPGSEHNICRYTQNELKRIGMDEVISRYKQPGFEFNRYQSPGG